MATKIYNDPWSPFNIKCNWKPEKLARYSFNTNLIDYQAEGIQIGYEQNGAIPTENNLTNLTDYIPVYPGNIYTFRCNNEGIIRGVYYISYFKADKTYIRTDERNPGLNGQFIAFDNNDSRCYYVRITLSKEAWKKCILRHSTSISYAFEEKNEIPLNIVDNIKETQIYKDLHFEVYVKAEALIKNFVDCFNLKEFQVFPDQINSYYSNNYKKNNLIFYCNTKNYYTFPNWETYHNYKVGDSITGVGEYASNKYVCLKNHTSDDEFNANPNKWYKIDINDLIPPSWFNRQWLNIDKNVQEENYLENFPFVGSLVFKNLWGCDMFNFLNTYVQTSYLTICYNTFFAKNLRFLNSHYNKFFEQGYFSDINLSEDSNKVDGFGVRLIKGESFENDEILGNASLNNYFSFSENRHSVDKDWSSDEDEINNTYFKGKLVDPFDHLYAFEPKNSIPFFKKKEFKDFKLELVLQKEDKLGNLFQRVVDLPIYVVFVNNLIKGYFQDGGVRDKGLGIYQSEYLNSDSLNRFSYIGENGFKTNIVIWCPNVKNLSVSSTILNPAKVQSFPKLININGDENSPLDGQTCILTWTSKNNIIIDETVIAIHSLEYSDGENYDKFIFHEAITRRASTN